jgi:hypothetical protein
VYWRSLELLEVRFIEHDKCDVIMRIVKLDNILVALRNVGLIDLGSSN